MSETMPHTLERPRAIPPSAEVLEAQLQNSPDGTLLTPYGHKVEAILSGIPPLEAPGQKPLEDAPLTKYGS